MLTKNQKMMFQKILDGEITALEKADFYYRMSHILKKHLEYLETCSLLIETIPPKSRQKIDLPKAVNDTKKLLKALQKLESEGSH